MHGSKFVSAACLAATLFFAGCDPGLVRAASVAVQTPVSTQETAQQARVRQQKTQQLIDAVEQAYKSGLDNYHAGHLEAAKASFDYAVDQMLMSGLDLKNDPQLSAEFDHIVDAVNTIELDALKQGNGFAPAAEPTPVGVANDVTFAVDPVVKARALADLKTTQSDLPLVLNDYVASYINYFANTKIGHNTLVNSLTRASKYKQMIQRVLAEEGVPQDLIYQAVAESGFQVRVMNGGGSGAGGMWQFMPGDAHAPRHSAYYDERFDPEKSTHAYAKYIKFLYNQLGDWYLAMAAYDWGAGNVQRSVQRTGYADFWELYRRNVLPQETKNYVPIILAATIMAKNPKQYGLDTIVTDSPLLTDTVVTSYSVDMRLVADIVGAPVQEVVSLNPSLLRMITPPDESFTLHLPPGTKDLYSKRIEEIPVERRRSWRFHKVAEGETIEDVARSYHVSASELAFVNQLGTSTDLSSTESLVIPVAAVASSSTARASRYVTRKGDTLVTVADRFNVSVDDLRGWNHLKGASLTPGHSLYVSAPARVSSAHGRRSTSKKPRGTSDAATKSSHSRASSSAKSAHASTAHSASKKPKKTHSSKP